MSKKTEILYPGLLERFPDELIDQAVEAAHQSPLHFKQWLLVQCHEYSVNMLELYHKYSAVAQLRIAFSLSDLSNLERLLKEEQENAESTGTGGPEVRSSD